MEKWLKLGTVGLALVCITGSQSASLAQLTGQGGAPGPNSQRGGVGRQVRPPARNYLAELKTIIGEQAKKFEVRILVDPTIFVPAMPKFTAESDNIDKTMDALAAQFKGTSWRRIYLSQSQAGVIPAPEKLANAVRAMDEIQNAGLVLENPGTKKASTLIKDYTVTQNFPQELTANQFNNAPVYIFYAKTPMADAMTPEEKYLDLQRQQMEMMMNMTPDQMAQSMASGMQMFMNMDPSVRSQFMGNMMRSGMQMFQNMSAEDRNTLMQGAMQAFQGGGFGAPRGGGRP